MSTCTTDPFQLLAPLVGGACGPRWMTKEFHQHWGRPHEEAREAGSPARFVREIRDVPIVIVWLTGDCAQQEGMFWAYPRDAVAEGFHTDDEQSEREKLAQLTACVVRLSKTVTSRETFDRCAWDLLERVLRLLPNLGYIAQDLSLLHGVLPVFELHCHATGALDVRFAGRTDYLGMPNGEVVSATWPFPVLSNSGEL